MKKVSILITTYNRLEQLKLTLNLLRPHLSKGVELLVCDDKSTDGTFEYLKQNYPEVRIIRNRINSGYIYSRNKLFNLVKTPYAVSLDDDANFLSDDSISLIVDHFEKNPRCGVLAFRVFWGKSIPATLQTREMPLRVKGFVGCGHAWRLKAWQDIPDYPEWFKFYGEEEFSSFQLFKKEWEVCYFPSILVHHRVNIKQRKTEKDYVIRLRRSISSGWYLYFLFLPWKLIPRKLIYSIWMQLKLKVFKGDRKAFIALTGAFFNLFKNVGCLAKNREPLSIKEIIEFKKLPNTKIYWYPKERPVDSH